MAPAVTELGVEQGPTCEMWLVLVGQSGQSVRQLSGLLSLFRASTGQTDS